MTRYSAIDATVGALLDATLATPNLDEGFKRALSGIAASTRSSPALDRAVAEIGRHAMKVRQRQWYAVKLGAEIILNDLAAGNPCTFERALNAPVGSVARRQYRLAMRWRRRRGSLAVPPSWRGMAARKSWERMGVSL